MKADILTVVFTKFRARLISTARGVTASDEDADDILQEAFARLWERREKYSSEEYASGVAFKTVRNLAIDAVRQRTAPMVSIDGDCNLPLLAPPPDDGTDDDSQVKAVMAIISRHLNERHQRVLILRDRWGWEMDEIAAELETTEANVRLMLSRARKAVRECYKQINSQQDEKR